MRNCNNQYNLTIFWFAEVDWCHILQMFSWEYQISDFDTDAVLFTQLC